MAYLLEDGPYTDRDGSHLAVTSSQKQHSPLSDGGQGVYESESVSPLETWVIIDWAIFSSSAYEQLLIGANEFIDLFTNKSTFLASQGSQASR